MRILAFVMLFGASVASAASFVTVQCQPPAGITVLYTETANSSACRGGTANSGFGMAQASGQVSLQLASNPSAFSQLTTVESAIAQQGLAAGANAYTSVSIDYQTTLQTLGAQRPGYLQLGFTFSDQFFYDGFAQISTGLLLPQSAVTTTVKCGSIPDPSLACSPGIGYYQIYPLIPVTLGSGLTLQSLGSLSNQASMIDGISGGSLSVTYQFRFLEADGVTPVVVAEVPEPETVMLLLLGMCAIVCWRARPGSSVRNLAV